MHRHKLQPSLKFTLPTCLLCFPMSNYSLTLLILGAWAAAIPAGAILTESPLNPHVNPTPFPSLTTTSSGRSHRKVAAGVSLSGVDQYEISTFAPFSYSSSSHEPPTGTYELGSTRFNGETNTSNYVDADYYKQQDSFLPSSQRHSHPLSLFSPTTPTRSASSQQSATKPYKDSFISNGWLARFPKNGRIPAEIVQEEESSLDFLEISTTSPPSTRLPSFSFPSSPGGESEFISESPPLQQKSSGYSHFFQSSASLSGDGSKTRAGVTRKRSVDAKEQSPSITRFPDKPSFNTQEFSSASSNYSPTPDSTAVTTTVETEGGVSTTQGKQSNINLLRKLWKSSRSGKFNLTDEHRSILRIESESVTPPIVRAHETASSSSPPPPSSFTLEPADEKEDYGQQQHQNQVTTTNGPTSTSEKSTRFHDALLGDDAHHDDVDGGVPQISSHDVPFTEKPSLDAIQNDEQDDGEKGKESDVYVAKSASLSKSILPSLSTTTIKPTPAQRAAPLLSSTPFLADASSFDMTSLHSSSNSQTNVAAGTTTATVVDRTEQDHAKEIEFNQQAPLLSVQVTTSNSSFPSPSTNLDDVDSPFLGDVTQGPSLENKVLERKEDEEATVVTTKLAFPFAENTVVENGNNARENLIKLKESLSSSSAAQLGLADEKGSSGKMEAPPRQEHHLMLYPEWLSSGGVYPDDDTSAQASSSLGALAAAAVASYVNSNAGNGTSSGSNGNAGSGSGAPGGAEYYTEPEYEPLISGEGSSVSRISSHLYNFAVPNQNLPPPPPLSALTEEEDIRDEEEFKRYARLREKLADELLQDVVAAAGARRNWQNGRNGNGNNNREQQMMMQQPEGEEVEGLGERESRYIVDSSKLGSGGGNGNGGVVSTESPQAIIAQQSGLADVISRGRIDSVMYVYFGDKLNDYHTEEIAGRVIQAVGGVIAAVAQVLTVLGAAKCVRRNGPTHTLPVHLHIGFALLISNLLLLLAVHATEPTDICATVAMILHYLHLVIGCWLFAHTVQTYRELRRHVESPNLLDDDAEDHRFGEVPRRPTRPNILPYCFAAWSAPLPFILMSYLVNPDGYETRHYCWMSIEKGMVVSFIVPVFLLIGMNTLLVVLALRHLLALRKLWHDSSGNAADVIDEHSLDEKLIGNGIRASAMLLPLLAVMWFLEVVALENSTSIFFQVAAAIANIALSWLVMYFLGNEIWPELWCQFSKVSRANSLLSMDDPCVGSSVQPSAAHLSFDNEPLLGGGIASASVTPSSSSSTAIMTSRTSASSMIMPSTSKAATTGTATAVAAAASSVASPSATNNNYYTSTTSFSSMAKKSSTGQYVNPKGVNNMPMSTNANNHASSNGMQHNGVVQSSAPLLGGQSKKNTKGGLLMKSKPNWSQPGGNEIYELKLDSISTICK